MMRTALALIVWSACAGTAPDSNGGHDAPPPPAITGLVSEPAHGSVVAGDPAALSIHVAGVYGDATRALAVQVLADPADLTSWQTIAAAQATEVATEPAGAFAFAVDVQPVASDAERRRWPIGGVLRLRVVDDTGLALPYAGASQGEPVPSADAATTVLALANRAAPPATWTYLSEQPVGSVAETQAYYAAIDAPATLADFMTRFGFPGDETTAVYYNAGDLGIGREMHCRATETPAGGLACYVRNFGTFGGLRDDAIAQLVAAGTPLATVAMVYAPPVEAPNAVTFMVYGPDGARLDEAQLDTHGDNKSVPQNCLNCHGGRSRYDPAAHAVANARFLPFDPAAFEYADRPDLTLAAQEEKLRRMNRLVANAAPTAGVREMIEGMFPVTNTPYDPMYVPAAWAESPRDARVYRDAIAPYCRSCHTAFENGPADTATFATPAGVRARASSTVAKICGPGPHGMPTAEATATRFFDSGARALLLAWLDAPGACAPSAP